MVAIKVETSPVIFAFCYKPSKSGQPTRRKKNLIWIGRDFNLPDIDWKIKSTYGYQYSKQLNKRFIDLIDSCGMEQVVNFPKRKQNLISSNLPLTDYKTNEGKDYQLEKS